MFQYYLRAAGLALSWVGTGRLIFSLNYTDADFAEVADRFVSAAREMQRDGWWWPEPLLTNKSIRRRVLKEMLQARWVAAAHRIDQLAAQQVQRRLAVELHVVERVGDDLGQPHAGPVCTSLRKNRCTVRNSSAPMPTMSQISPTWRTNSCAAGVRAGTGRRTSGRATAAPATAPRSACRITLRRRL